MKFGVKVQDGSLFSVRLAARDQIRRDFDFANAHHENLLVTQSEDSGASHSSRGHLSYWGLVGKKGVFYVGFVHCI